MSLRSFLFKAMVLSNDLNAIKRNKVGRRIVRKVVYRNIFKRIK